MLKSFDDIRIIPQVSRIGSRKECDTSTKLGNFNFKVPLLVASMHSIVSDRLIYNVEYEGSGAIQPRNDFSGALKPMFSTSMDNALFTIEMAQEIYKLDEFILSIEIANGYTYRMANIIDKVKSKYPNLFVIGGTVAEYEGCKYLQDSGFDAILLSIGVGGVCLTTVNTGVGLPAIASLMDVKDKDINIPIILSGGVRTYGDFCKAIALGADFVMSGSLFKGCSDSANSDRYWGEASRKEKLDDHYIEGTEIRIEPNGKTSGDIIREAKEALQSAMSYSDSFTIKEFQKVVKIGYLE